MSLVRRVAEVSTTEMVSTEVKRAILVLSLLVYSGSLHLSHSLYLQTMWQYLGFTYSEPNLLDYLFAGSLIFLAGLLMPIRFYTASSVFLIAIGLVVFIPSVVITVAIEHEATAKYGWILLALAIAFFAGCLVCKENLNNKPDGEHPGRTFAHVMLGFWMVGTVTILAVYGDRLRIVGFGDVYDQRAVGAANSVITAYLQTYYLGVVCPTILTIGLLDCKRRWMILVGLIGFILAYSIAAQKTALFIPTVMLVAFAAMTTAGRLLSLTATMALLLAVAIGIAIATYKIPGANWFAAIVVHRTLAIPGLTLTQYDHLFGQVGFTFWTHVRGVSSLLTAPEALRSNPLWPNLGYLVGESAYRDPKINVNANLFSSDGVAAAGAIGVIAIGVVFAAWLKVLDWAASGWDRRFVALVLVPVAISLTNGPLFTVLLSFGGIFWIVLLSAYKPKHG